MAGVAFESARLELARVRLESNDEYPVALTQVLRVCARALAVERVGFWEISPDGEHLVCHARYAAAADAVETGLVQSRRDGWGDSPALNGRRLVAASEDRTAASARLDAAVFRAGAVHGVVRCEHVGAARHWTGDELGFGAAVADRVGSLLDQLERFAARDAAPMQLAEMIAAEKLAVNQNLSRALAHDFANLVTAVEMVGARLHQRSGEDHELGGELASVARIAEELLAQLRRLGGRRHRAPQLRPLRTVIEELAPVLSILTRGVADVALDLQLDGAVAALGAEPLEQILLSLTLNARAAIDIYGHIAVRARGDSERLILELSDDGAGIAPEIIDDIWAPQFTTKDDGSGLGLTSIRAIVEGAGGTISVESSPGQGTTFRMCLPRASAEQLELESDPEDRGPPGEA